MAASGFPEAYARYSLSAISFKDCQLVQLLRTNPAAHGRGGTWWGLLGPSAANDLLSAICEALPI
eukprot:3853410-Karenia_brevis.AAC.1